MMNVAGASSVTEEPVMSHDQMRDRMRRIHSCVFGCEVDALTAVPDEARLAGGGQGLDDYMTLPVDQYADLPLPLGTYMEKLPAPEGTPATDRLFQVVIPSLKFLTLEVRVYMQLRVELLPATHPRGRCVHVTATGARVEGDVADSLRINDNFVVEASTRIRWSNSSEGRGGQAQISTDSATVVGVEPPGPFALLPLTTLEQAGGFVISGTVRVMQDVFVRSLADDYRRWATDAVYRGSRAAAVAALDE